MRTTKVFISGNSQAVRLPKDFQFRSRDVAIEKRGNKVILWEVPQNLSRAFDLLGKMPEDFYSEERVDEPSPPREDFE